MISFIIPTRNRPDALQRTIRMIERCCARFDCSAETIVIDNASDAPLRLPHISDNRLGLHILRSEINLGAAARNLGAESATNDWLIMLDDDSHPLDGNFVQALNDAPSDVAAIGAKILLPDGSREHGGLPEVIIGCGAAIRRNEFLAVRGYDSSFDYYAEEYDLCAKLLMRGRRVIHDCRFRVLHEKLNSGRDFNRIIHRLVRNNAWIAQRYAPAFELDGELHGIISRYAAISIKEDAAAGFAAGMDDLLRTNGAQPRTPMHASLWDRFTGLAHARRALSQQRADLRDPVAIVDAGKNEWAVRMSLADMGIQIVDDEAYAESLVIGTLSPGPMLDAFDRRSRGSKAVLCPWWPEHAAQPELV